LNFRALGTRYSPVLLCFGKRIGAFLFEGILGSENKERFLELIAGIAEGDLSFLHGFQQGALNFRRGAVDLIGEDEVGKDGTFANDEFVLLLIVDHGPDDVGGKEIGGELDPAEFGVDGLRQ